MGKPSGNNKKKKNTTTTTATTTTGSSKSNHSHNHNQHNAGAAKSKQPFDEDMDMFISMSQELKEEGNKLFQKRDHEGAMLKYEKAVKLLPASHTDVAYLRTNMAGCYMQMGLGEYPRAINECNLALQVFPRNSKALLKRAKCFESLNRLDLAYRDVNLVLNMEANNLVAVEVKERLKGEMERKGIKVEDKEMILEKERVVTNVSKVKKKKKSNKGTTVVERVVEEKKVVEIGRNIEKEEETRSVKLVFGDDIRWAQLPLGCGVEKVREMVMSKFSCSSDVLIKYKDREGDLVTITTTEELRWAEAAVQPHGSIRLYIVDVNPQKVGLNNGGEVDKDLVESDYESEDGEDEEDLETVESTSCIEEWILQFAQLFKNHVGFSADEYLDLHELGMKLYSDALEDAISSEEAQGLFDSATQKFQEMTALSLFNWGNVHMSRARKKVSFSDDASKETILEQVKTAYEWAQKEYVKAGKRYEEALKIKPDFFEAYFALGQQQFEQAKLSWSYAVGSKVDLETWPSTEVLQLFNKSEDNMERGMQLWEQIDQKHLNQVSKPGKVKPSLQKVSSNVFKDIWGSESAEHSSDMRCQINLLWGIILYERSIVEFKLELPVWKECLEVSVEKFEIAGASPTDITIMIKNHCANQTAVQGLGFHIDEIVQAWSEMYDAQKWQIGVPSSRLEPLFRRRVPKLHHMLEHI